MFAPSEVELGETTEAMIAVIDEIRPQRVVLDSLSELRLIAQSSTALPAAGAGAEAVLRGTRLHGADAR